MKNKTIKIIKTYKPSDYNSGDGMLTTVWGPGMWHFLHTMSFNYPIDPSKEQKNHYRNFILSLVNVLPCKYCRINLKKNLKALPLKYSDMNNRDTFSRYIYNLHEHINKMLGKISGLTYNMVRERYEHFRARCSIKNNVKTEKGCTESLYGEKAKCILRIVPQTKKCNTFEMDEKCKKKRVKILS
jgi:hypothetical protein